MKSTINFKLLKNTILKTTGCSSIITFSAKPNCSNKFDLYLKIPKRYYISELPRNEEDKRVDNIDNHLKSKQEDCQEENFFENYEKFCKKYMNSFDSLYKLAMLSLIALSIYTRNKKQINEISDKPIESKLDSDHIDENDTESHNNDIGLVGEVL